MSDRESGRSTVCPLCAVGCRLAPGEGGRARGRPGPANPEGRLCRKGVTAFEGIEGRLTEPRVRESDGEDGALVPAEWSRAYERVVAGIEAAVEAGGPDAVAFLGAPQSTNEENYLLEKLARMLGTNNVDNRARHCHVSATRALAERLGWPATTNGLDDLREADAILVVGANPAARQPVAFNSFVRPAVTDGATLVHVDPVGNRTTRLADVHLAPRPETDALVLDLLCARVLDDGNADEGFVEGRTNGFEEFAAAIGDVDREAGVAAADVDADTLERVGALVGEAGRVAAIVGTGIEDNGDSRDTDEDAGGEDGRDHGAADSLLNLLLLTGNVGRRGTGLFVFRGPPNEQGAIDAGCVPDRLPGHQPVTDPEARARVAAEWGVEPPANPGTPATEMLAEFGESIRAAVVVGENPAVSKRDGDWVGRRLDALDHLAVVELGETETTAHADVVLPAAAGVEKAGTVTNLDRRIQRLRPVVDPPAGVRTDSRILCDLAERLSIVGATFDYDRPAEVFAELARVAPTHEGVAYGELDGGWRWPADEVVLYRDRFETPDGRAPFVSPASDTPNAVAEPDPGPDLCPGNGFRLVVGGRAGDAGNAESTDRDRRLRIHPGDAARAGVESGERVAVSDDERTVDATVEVDGSVRRGTVFLHATVADPFVRAGTTVVRVETQ